MYKEVGFIYDPDDDIIFWHTPQLAQSGRTGAKKAVTDGRVQAVLFTCHGEADAIPPDLRARLSAYKQIAVPDDVEDVATFVRGSVPFIAGNIAQGRKVLVHCSYGRNRSSLAILAYLLLSDGTVGVTIPEVLAKMKAVNPATPKRFMWSGASLSILPSGPPMGVRRLIYSGTAGE